VTDAPRRPNLLLVTADQFRHDFLAANAGELRDVAEQDPDVVKELRWRMKHRLYYSAWRR